jgi:hypothetical protein
MQLRIVMHSKVDGEESMLAAAGIKVAKVHSTAEEL